MTCPLCDTFGAVKTPQTLSSLGQKQSDRESRIWTRADRMRQSAEPAVARSARVMLDDLTEAVTEEIERTGASAQILQETPGDLVRDQVRRHADIVEDFLAETWQDVGTDFARLGWRQARGEEKVAQSEEEAEVEWLDEVDRFLREEGSREVRNIAATTRDRINEILQQGAEDGLGAEALARRIEDEIDATNRIRARRIARTEIITASNKASNVGAAATGLTLVKEWIHTADDRTREAHLQMTGERKFVAMDEEFVLPPDGETADYPGDPSLSAAQRVNCRCAIAHLPADDVDQSRGVVLS